MQNLLPLILIVIFPADQGRSQDYDQDQDHEQERAGLDFRDARLHVRRRD
jgi:hypothetical protein